MYDIRIRGAFALFTQPGLGVERVSYPIITPPATVGVLRSIFWHPGMEYRVHKIGLLKPPRFIGIMRNEVEGGLIGTNTRLDEPYMADEHRSQRHALVLRDVDYIVKVSIHVDMDENRVKFMKQFERRLPKGQCYYQPCLGCREFAADVFPAVGDEVPLDIDIDIGWMPKLYRYYDGQKRKPLVFHAKVKKGILEVP